MHRLTPAYRLTSLLLLATCCGGCNILIPLMMASKHEKTIPAEFDKLEGKRAAVIVWAPQEVLFDYPFVRLELGVHVADKLRTDVKDVEIVDGRRIEDYLERTLENYVDPQVIGEKFACEVVIYIELLEFQIRDPAAPDFLRAQIHASIVAYDLQADPDEAKRYELEDVKFTYPENRPVLLTPTNSVVIRKGAYEQFTEMVCRKFHEYKEEIE